MNFTKETTEQYALVRLDENEIAGDIATSLETLSRGFFRDGYSNIILDLAAVQTIAADGVMVIRKVNRQCTNEQGLLVLVTKDEDMIEFLDSSRIPDLTILPTVEEAIDAVFMNELENDFRGEDDDEYDGGFSGGRESDY